MTESRPPASIGGSRVLGSIRDRAPALGPTVLTSTRAGTVTLLFTDIEGSTRLIQELGEGYEPMLAEHRRVLREAFRAEDGTEIDAAGDGFFYAFPRARGALTAAIAGQRALGDHDWPGRLRVRMGLHTGEPAAAEAGYVGIDVHRAARIGASGHGGQILVSRATRDLAAGDLPADVGFLDLGQHRLKDLQVPEHLFQVVAPGLDRDFPPLRSIDSRPNNLPGQLTTFIGRHEQIAEAKRTLATARLLTLTGPGGVGKTRLSIELATELLADFEAGAWFVDLAPLTDPEFVVQAIASALHVVDTPGQPLLDTVVDHLRGQPTLLILDNCEHLVDAVARTIDILLRSCSSIRVIATSREALAVAGEASFPVPSLSVPEADSVTGESDLAHFEAVRLFAERAVAAAPGFTISSRNGRAVAQICQRLDGVPLALELAAARVRALPVEQIANRLDDRFRLLTGSSRVAVPRHQTLRQTIDWSHDLLSGEERAVFRRLSVFAGGGSLAAAEVVCAGGPVEPEAVFDILSRLVDKSLLVADTEGEEARYRQLETIREYARDRLVESGEARDAMRRHGEWCRALVAQAEPEFFRGVESAGVLDRIDHEHDNLRTALQWSLDEPGEARAGLQLAAGLWRFWEIRGHLIEGRNWLERLLDATGDEVSALRADAYTAAGVLAFMLGDQDGGAALHERSLALHREVGDGAGIAYAANNLANAAVLSGDYATARQLYSIVRSWSEEIGDPLSYGFAIVNMAEAVALDGEPDLGRTQYEQGVAIFRRQGNRWAEAMALDSFGATLARLGDLPAAASHHEEALAISREIGDDRGVARALGHLAEVAGQSKDPGRAKALYAQSLEIRQTLGDLPGLAATIEKLAGAIAEDDPRGAAILLGAAEVVRERIRAPIPPTVRDDYEGSRRRILARLGDEGFDEARAEGRRQSPAAALATVLG